MGELVATVQTKITRSTGTGARAPHFLRETVARYISGHHIVMGSTELKAPAVAVGS